MYQVNSQTMTDDFKSESVPLKEWKFQIENGNTGEMSISNPLISSEAIATERARSEFLKNAYKVNEVNFSTHRTDIVKNMTINLYGIPYLVKRIQTSISEKSIITRVMAVRYE